MRQLGLRIDLGKRSRRKEDKTTALEIDTDSYVVDESPSMVAMIESDPGSISAFPQVEEGLDISYQQPAISITSKGKITPLVSRLNAAVNYVTVFTVIRFVPETVEQEEKFALVWNDDRKWPSFPGGGIETRETIQQASIRETHEETNLEIGGVVKKIGRLAVDVNAYVGIFAADLPYSQIANIKWGIEQRPEWESKLKAVSAAFIDRLVASSRLMPNHIKTWEFYKKYYLLRKSSQ